MSAYAISLAPNFRRVRRWLPRQGDASVDFLWLLMALTLVRGVIYAILNPPFGSPDEWDHFQYVQHLATFGNIGSGGAEENQPIPYYALMVPAYWLTAGQSPAVQDLAIRFASLPFLLGIVLFTWLAARKMVPDGFSAPLIAAAFVALQSENTVIGASASNDIAANFVAALLTYLVVSMVTKHGRWTALSIVVAVGAALMTKGQILPVAAISGVVLLVYFLKNGRSSKPARLVLYACLVILTVGLALAAREGELLQLWRAKSALSLLGEWPRLAETAQRTGLTPFSYQLTSFWGAFLGESVRPCPEWYFAPTAVTLFASLGYFLTIARRSKASITLGIMLPRVVLASMIIVQWLALYLFYLRANLIPGNPWPLQAFQGRYMLPILAPLGLLVGDGWSLVPGRGYQAVLCVGVLAVLASFDISSLASLVGHYNWSTGN